MAIFWSLLMFTVLAEAEVPMLAHNNIQYIRSHDAKEQLRIWEEMESNAKEKRLERAEALFFIPNSAELAIDLLRKEKDPEIKQILLLCVGKHGQASQIQVLLTILQQKAVLLPSDSAVAALRALSMMASRGKLTTNRIELAAMLLQQRQVIDPVQRRLVATIIAQLEIPALPKELEDELVKAMYNEIDGETAALILRSIAQLRRPLENLEDLEIFWRTHSAWEVRTAYAQWYGWKDEKVAKELSSDIHQQVRTQIQQSLASAGRLPKWREESLLNDSSIGAYQKQIRGENSNFEEARIFVRSWRGTPPDIFGSLLDAAYPTKIRIAAAQVQQDRQILYELHTTANEIELRRAAGIRIAELSTTSAERKALLNNNDPEVVSGTASVLAKDPKGNSEKDLWTALNTEAPDWMNLSVMHALLSIHKQGKSRSLKEHVKRDLKPFIDNENPAVSSLASLLMEVHELEPPKLNLNYPPEVSPLPCGIRLHTTAGEIRISLNTDKSPNSIGQIQNLIRSESISDVNLFTPQHTLQIGQNPPQNYVLDEHNLAPFERGTVGIALRTPNSGGSQIFVSFRERPDFIGSYTNIGHVSYGLETLMGYPYSDVHSAELEYCNTEE